MVKLGPDESASATLDKEIEEVTEGEELATKERLKTKCAGLEAVVGVEGRVRQVTEDIVPHFEDRRSAMEGKGLVVAMARQICIDLHDAIADAARTLNEQRERWLNSPEWIAEIAERIDAEDDFADVARVSGEEARRLIRQSAIDAAAAKDKRLKNRTLTNLYNERPTWLRLAHKALDEAVLAAYAATDPAGDWTPAWAEVFEETGAGQPLPGTPAPDGEGDPTPHPLAERRAEVEQAILGNLLRMNLARAATA